MSGNHVLRVVIVTAAILAIGVAALFHVAIRDESGQFTRPILEFCGLISPADENIRMEQMLFQSEGHRKIRDEWKQFWGEDMPSHLTPQRVHGGITP